MATSRLSYICDRVIEAGWLAAIVFTPLYFNVYSSRVFEPDKISFLRNIVALATVAWIIKLVEGTLARRGGQGRTQALVESAAPGWMPGWLRVPMVLPLLTYALIFMLSTIFSVVPLTSIFGSYQRFQGTISQFTYIMLAVLIITNMRSRAQLERFITFCIITSIPVSLYGLLQATGNDPLPWAGDVQTRVASTMGNAIFVAAFLIMVVPLTLQRLIGAIARLRSGEEDEAPQQRGEEHPWALAIIGTGAIFMVLLLQYAGVVTGNNILPGQPDIGMADIVMWVLVLLGFGLFGWAANSVAGQALAATRGTRRGESAVRVPLPLAGLVPVLQVLAFWVAIGVVGNSRVPDFRQWIVIPAAIFVIYALGYLLTLESHTTRASATLQVTGLSLLLAVQVLVVFLSQSRGPLLGLIVGLGVFAFALLLRRRMYRPAAALGAVAVLFLGFLVVFNLPNSPIAEWRNLPYVGRLGTITEVHQGTGKVRTLIWEGATNLILSEPARTVIGWGPEAMYVAYNRFYPPELGRWELRNATPDRSHNVFFDQVVTMGVIGLFGYLFLIGSFVWYSVRALRKAANPADQLIIIGLFSTVVAHVVELSVGIQIAATYTYFYTIVGALVAFGYFMMPYLRQDEAAVVEAGVGDTALAGGNGHGAVEAVPVPEPALAGARQASARAGTRSRDGGAAPAQAGKKGYAAATPRGGDGGSRRATPAPGGRITPQSGRGGSPRGTSVRPALTFSHAASSPLMVGIYTLALLLGALYVVGLNVNAIKADMFYKQGLAADQARQWEGAIAPYEKAIAISPTEDFYYLFLGRAFMEWSKTSTDGQQAGQLLQRAEDALKRANRLNPLNTDHYANLGRLYVHWGDSFGDPARYSMALEWYARAHQLSPGNAQLWNEYGVALDKAGRYEDAVRELRGAVATDPSFALSHFILAEVLRTQANRLVAQASAPGVSPEMSATLNTEALQLTQEAGASYASAAKIDPNLMQDGQLEVRVGELIARQAITPVVEGYRAVIAEAQRHNLQEPVVARAILGFILWRMGQTPGAIAEFERAVALSCNDYYNLRNLGMLYAEVGQKEPALNTLEGALAVAECDPTANFCPAHRSAVQAGTCQPLTNLSGMQENIADLRNHVARLKQELGR